MTDEILDNVLDPKEPIDPNELDVIIQLNDENRCIACDCTVLEDDKYITLKRKDLPVDYDKFSRDLDKYKYISGKFEYCPIEQEPTFEEKVLAEQERQAQAIEELIILTLGGK